MPANNIQNKSIMAESPFTTIYSSIERMVSSEIEIHDYGQYEENPLYNEDFVRFLLFFFMPYIFIWGGFVFRGINGGTKWLTQDCVEQIFRSKKLINEQPQVPARYVRSSFDLVVAQSTTQQAQVERLERVQEGEAQSIIDASRFTFNRL
jgi:hypothetical protein